MNTKEVYLTWLNNMYAYQHSLLTTYKKRAGGEHIDQEIAHQLTQHAAKTEEHLKDLEQIITKNGGEVSGAKSVISTITGNVDVLATSPLQGDEVYNVLIDFASEMTAVAAYEGLVTAAKLVGDDESIHVLHNFAGEEKKMANFLQSCIPTTVNSTLERLSKKSEQ